VLYPAAARSPSSAAQHTLPDSVPVHSSIAEWNLTRSPGPTAGPAAGSAIPTRLALSARRGGAAEWRSALHTDPTPTCGDEAGSFGRDAHFTCPISVT